jgi:hypothetical protein
MRFVQVLDSVHLSPVGHAKKKTKTGVTEALIQESPARHYESPARKKDFSSQKLCSHVRDEFDTQYCYPRSIAEQLVSQQYCSDGCGLSVVWGSSTITDCPACFHRLDHLDSNLYSK